MVLWQVVRVEFLASLWRVLLMTYPVELITCNRLMYVVIRDSLECLLLIFFSFLLLLGGRIWLGLK